MRALTFRTLGIQFCFLLRKNTGGCHPCHEFAADTDRAVYPKLRPTAAVGHFGILLKNPLMRILLRANYNHFFTDNIQGVVKIMPAYELKRGDLLA